MKSSLITLHARLGADQREGSKAEQPGGRGSEDLGALFSVEILRNIAFLISKDTAASVARWRRQNGGGLHALPRSFKIGLRLIEVLLVILIAAIQNN